MSFVTSPVESIIVSNRFRKEPGDIQALAENIDEIGLLHPIAVTPDRRLIAGRTTADGVQVSRPNRNPGACG
jgi:ParB family chromosome partitioning protein